MKLIQNLFVIASLSLTLVGAVSAQDSPESKKDYGPCFKLIDQKAFDEAEKEASSSAEFGIGRDSTLPKIARGNFHHPEDGTTDVSVHFPPIEQIPDFWPGMLLRIVLVYKDGKRETLYFESKGRIDSLKGNSGKKVVTPFVKFDKIATDDRKITVIEVTALTMKRDGKRIKYTGDLRANNGG